MMYRLTSKATTGRMFCSCLFAIVILTIIYLYWTNAQESYKHSKWAEKRCISELSSVKYQLDVVTDYKAHVEIMLTECQKAHSLEKDKFKDVAESCLTMKQQSSLCQNQFDDLQNECKKVRETYNKEKSEIENLQVHLDEEIKRKDEAQRTIDELFGEIENLRKTNGYLMQKLQQSLRLFESHGLSSFQRTPINNNRTFSEVVAVMPDEYELKMRPLNITVENKTEQSKILKVDFKDDKKNDLKNNRAAHNEVPPGFAPVLPVVENPENTNILKPPRDLPENIVPDKLEYQNDKKYDNKKTNDKDLEIIDSQDSRDGIVMNDNEVLIAPLDNIEKHPPEDDLNNARVANQPAQEDDDEGEEYNIQ